MRHFYVPKGQISGSFVHFSGGELHHLANVLRLRVGDKVTVFDGEGGIYEVLLVSIQPSIAVGEIESQEIAHPPQMEVTLFQGLPKADKMDMIIRIATELGVHKVVPVLCGRTIPKLSSRERSDRRVARWQQIAISASKQSRRPFFPLISGIMKFDEIFRESYAELKLIFVAPSATFVCPKKLKDVLKQNTKTKKVDIFIGPEGDFTEDEIQHAKSSGAIPVSLGDNILRTETAAVSALAIIFYELSNH